VVEGLEELLEVESGGVDRERRNADVVEEVAEGAELENDLREGRGCGLDEFEDVGVRAGR